MSKNEPKTAKKRSTKVSSSKTFSFKDVEQKLIDEDIQTIERLIDELKGQDETVVTRIKRLLVRRGQFAIDSYIQALKTSNDQIEVDYNWAVKDPVSIQVVDGGSESVNLTKRKTDIVHPLAPYPDNEDYDFDDRFYIISISVFHNGHKIDSFEKQKSPFDWNYSITPPKKEDMTDKTWIKSIYTSIPLEYIEFSEINTTNLDDLMQEVNYENCYDKYSCNMYSESEKKKTRYQSK